MGYDLLAYRNDGTLIERKVMTRQEKYWFTKASHDVIKTAGSVDIGLNTGSLDCSRSIHEFCGFIGITINHDGLIKNEVLKTAKFGRFSEEPYYQSAANFLLGCIRFGYDVCIV